MGIDCRSSEVSRGHSSIEHIDVKDRTWSIGDEGDINVHRGVAGATPEMLSTYWGGTARKARDNR